MGSCGTRGRQQRVRERERERERIREREGEKEREESRCLRIGVGCDARDVGVNGRVSGVHLPIRGHRDGPPARALLALVVCRRSSSRHVRDDRCRAREEAKVPRAARETEAWVVARERGGARAVRAQRHVRGQPTEADAPRVGPVRRSLGRAVALHHECRVCSTREGDA